MLTPEALQAHLDSLTKPPGSLGKLEDLAARLCRIQQTLRPATRPRRLVVFAADHGVVEEGVTAWGSDVTALMVRNIVGGGAASSVLARATGTELRLIDVGTLAGEMPDSTAHGCRKVRAGTRNLAREPALTADEFGRAVAIGREEARAAVADGVRVVAAGEMGIGNTTPASCLTALLAGAAVEECVGRGAGIGDVALGRKLAVVSRGVDAARARYGADPVGAMASVGGLEIAAIAGFFAEAAEVGLTVVLDGFVATSGALVAERLRVGTATCLIAAHRSAEPGHAVALAGLGLEPFLDTWRMRLGEGTGALLLMPLLDAAAAVVAEMATLSDAGIRPDEP